MFGEATAFGEPTYENQYVKQNGVWKISRLYAYFNMYTPYSAGWGEVGMPNTNPEAALPPDNLALPRSRVDGIIAQPDNPTSDSCTECDSSPR